ncbi:type II secretion system protein [Lentisphaera profundi]|uniref:Type II secretion system protein n=1 Tax=Lentisphaera profundi TaxID=1658616 RepID=A0ABY7VZX0_9BACT|nr:type II secretion system protein [Lentisphaera profundi]WDE97558.1 type II secretion system protein [Lentisphaera profundi]
MKKNFTLIELLVVVAIIGILASLLLPVLGKARKTARTAVCVSNMKQISTASYLYLDDNLDTFPGYYIHGGQAHNSLPMYSLVGVKGKQGGYVYEPEYKMVNPYLGDFTGDDRVPVAHCPLDEKPLNSAFSGDTTYDAIGSSYGLNSRTNTDLKIGGLDADGNNKGQYTGVSLSEISTASSEMVMALEVNAWHFATAGSANIWSTGWHGNNKYTMAFIDGHVKNMTVYDQNKNNDNYKFDRNNP